MAKKKADTKASTKSKGNAKKDETDTKAKAKASDKKEDTKAKAKKDTDTKAKAKTSDKKEEDTKAKSNGKSKSGTSNNQIVETHDDGWAVRKEGADAATEVFGTRVEAVGRARELAADQGGQVFIFREGGPAEA